MVKAMQKRPGISYLLPATVILILVMFILPGYSSPGYSILKNTTSHLGAQNAPNAWIMNLVFLLLGVAVILEAWFHLKPYRVQQFLLGIFGLGLLGVAIFQHGPIIEGISADLFEDMMHSVFATTVGFSFILFAVSTAFIETKRTRRVSALLIAVLAASLSALMFAVPDLAGLWQRIMFILAFGWLIIFFEGIRRGQVKA